MRSDDDWLIEGFGEVYPTHVTAFVELMTVLRHAFGGDLDLMLILAVIGDRRVWQKTPKEAVSYDALGQTGLPDSQTVAINTLSIANYTGIPRETVRRKVAALIERGWIEREDNGDLRPTRKAADDLRVGTEATITYLRAIVDACDRIRSG